MRFWEQEKFCFQIRDSEEVFCKFFLIVSHIFLPPVGGLEGGFIFAFLGAGESSFQKNASFEEDFVSFLLIVSRIFLPPVGGLEGALFLRFWEQERVLFSNSRF